MSTSRFSITSWIGTLCTSTSNIERSITSGFRPWLIVRLPCGSRSMSSTLCPCSAKATPRLRVVVVFATPPFWFANAMTLAVTGPLVIFVRGFGRGSRRASPTACSFRVTLAKSFRYAEIVAVGSDGTNGEALPRRLAVPVVEVVEPGDHADAAEVDLLGARVVADVVRLSRAVCEERCAVRAGAQAMRDARSR